MKTLLVLAQHPETAATIRSVLNPDQHRVIHRVDVAEAEPLLNGGLIDACLLDVEGLQVQGLWALEKIRSRLPNCPVLILAGSGPWEWTEEAYVQGAAHVLFKPVGARTWRALLEKVGSTEPATLRKPIPSSSYHPPALASALPATPSGGSIQTLKALRDFSDMLSHSLRAEGLLHEFLQRLREIIGVNRAAIFLRCDEGETDEHRGRDSRRSLRSACAIGLPSGLLEHFELSFASGIAESLYRLGRILRRDAPEAQQDAQIQKEFELLGAEVAIPIVDRERLIGVATFDGRVTGEPLSNGELELVFHLLEQLGLAVKNIWLHDQLVANHETLADILQHLSGACVVVEQDLTVRHVNRAAQKLFAPRNRRQGPLEFSDLPHLLGSKVYQVLQTGNGLAPFRFTSSDEKESVLQVTIVPIQKQPGSLPDSALLMAEDRTQSERLQRLEVESDNLRLLKTMADRLAHEIGNAMVPVATHQQLLGERFRDAEFRESLDTALADGVKRVNRLIHQMRYLARDDLMAEEQFPLVPLLEEAFQEAHKHQPVKSARLKYEENKMPLLLKGDRTALKHALAEVMLNALQANTTEAAIEVAFRLIEGPESSVSILQIDIKDNGQGFTAEAAQKVPTPFFTTRSVGLGLGLTVCRKIIEMHQGAVEVLAQEKDPHGQVRITLPAQTPASE